MSQTGGYAAADDGSGNAGPAENAGRTVAQHDPVEGTGSFKSSESAAADGRLQMTPWYATSFTISILLQKSVQGLRQLLLTVTVIRIRIKGATAVFCMVVPLSCSLVSLKAVNHSVTSSSPRNSGQPLILRQGQHQRRVTDRDDKQQ